jgi:hypothetical protein
MSPANEPRQSKAERTADAREKAREIREAQLKKDKRNKLLIGWGIVAAVVAILVVVALVVTTSLKNNAPVADQGPTPANGNVHGGVTLLATPKLQSPTPPTVNVQTFRRPAAGACNRHGPGRRGRSRQAGQGCPLHRLHLPRLQELRGDVQRDAHEAAQRGQDHRGVPPAGLPGQPLHHQLLLACGQRRRLRGERIPGEVLGLCGRLFANQPAEGGAGLSDDELKKLATDIGAKSIDSCVENKTYRPWVKYTTQEAAAIGVTGTPTVLVEGKQWGKGDSAQTPFPDFLKAAINAKA